MKLFFKKDALVVLAILAVAAGAWALTRAGSGSGAQAEVYLGGEHRLTLPLGAEERIFSLPERPQVLLQLGADGSIRFLESDCPDKVCIHSGKLHTPGQSAACLPNHVLVKITVTGSGENGAPGVIAG